MNWKKGRGKLGVFKPLLGHWQFNQDWDMPDGSDMGFLGCEKNFKPTLDNKYIQLETVWKFKTRDSYKELCLFGVDAKKQIIFWSFTNDGKQSQGELITAEDIHPQAIAFLANMPAGKARQVYWPDDDNGFYWAVESETKKGWNRFSEHHYKPGSGRSPN